MLLTKRQSLNCLWNAEKRECLHAVDGNVNYYSHYGKQYAVHTKTIELPYDLTVPLMDLYPKEMKLVNQRVICTPPYCSIIHNG
jgi:hypothetical protein